MTAQLDFTGHTVFAGMDVGKKSWKVCILTEVLEHKTFTQPPSVSVLVNYLHRNFPGARYLCAYEAGYCGFWIHDGLVQAGIECIVVNPADVPTTHKETTHKTDRVDARKLARSLRNGDLKPIYVPCRDALEDRNLVRIRERTVSKLTRCKNQIKGLLQFYGIMLPADIADHHWSKKFVLWLHTCLLQRTSGNQAFQCLLDELDYLRLSVATLTRHIRSLAQLEPYRVHINNLLSIPGINTLTAMTLLTELVTIDRFQTLDHLACFVGLVPGENSSGEIEQNTGITPRRNAQLRALLIESAWIAARKDPALSLAFTQLAQRMSKNRAIIRIARKLLNRIRFVLKHQQPYVLAVVQ
jgi:transposase